MRLPALRGDRPDAGRPRQGGAGDDPRPALGRARNTYARLLPHLAPSSARWARDASLLVVALTRRRVDDTGLLHSGFAEYDLGQAVAHLTVQAQAKGLGTHQFRAFDLDGLAKELDPDPGWVIVCMIAVGRAAGAPPEGRTRQSVAHLRSAPWSSAQEPPDLAH
nr:nitroreductase family protein [Streptomyces sp. SCA2-2]